MESYYDLRYFIDIFRSFFEDLKKLCSPETYRDRLRICLFSSRFEGQDNPQLVDLFIEYADLSLQYQVTFEHMINNNIGLKEPSFYHYFFNKLKYTNYRRALQCIQIAKQFSYSNFDQIDIMTRELESILIKQLSKLYQSKHMSQKQIDEKIKTFQQSLYQSKNKRIVIQIDEQFRRLNLQEMINEIESFNNEDCLNPEETDYSQLNDSLEIKLIKPKFQKNNLQIITQSPNFSNDIAVSEELNKLTPISASSASSRNVLHQIKSHQQQKLIIPIPTINQQHSPIKSLNRMKFKSIQKLRQLLFDNNEQSLTKEPLELNSPK